MFQELSKVIDNNISIYVSQGYYDKVFRNEYVTDKFYILLNNKYAVEILANHQDDIIYFFLLKLDPESKIDETEGYYKFSETGAWKRLFLEEVCDQLQIIYDVSLLKRVGSFEQRINNAFKAFEIFFRDYKNYLEKFGEL